MTISFYQVDAFTNTVFGGNPAGVCPLDKWLPDETLCNIAAENNLPETAFFIVENGRYHIRWFTPTVEVPLCGHATLATAHVIFRHLGFKEKTLYLQSASGELRVKNKGDLLELNFPPYVERKATTCSIADKKSGILPIESVYAGNFTIAFLADETTVRNYEPDLMAIKELPGHGLVITAPGDKVDFVSRFFAPAIGIDEDPVTGATHCALVPLWTERLGKSEVHALQVSARGGELFCGYKDGRVLLAGKAVTYLKGELFISS